MTYTQIFGGTTIYPSDVSYLALTLSADKALEWPLENNDPSNPAARIIDVTTSGAYSITLPDATQTGAGQTILFNNLSGSTNSFTLKDYAGNTVATVGIGEQWQAYLAGVATAAGTWRVFRYGASTATVQASALAGYGLTVTSNTLSQSLPVTTFNSTRSVLATDRASALVWNGTGTGTLNLIAAGTVGNNFFVAVRNSGGGDLTVDAAGSETIDGAGTLVLRPGESTNLMTDGVTWYTLGLGQEAVFAFDYTSITVTGGTYTLAGSELNRIAYKFVGALTSDQYIVVPPTIQQYWVDNGTTGVYNFYLQTSGGTRISVPQGGRGIYYCNGTNVVDADTATISLPVSATDGGTGQTSYTTGDLLYASSATTLAKLPDVATGNVLRSGGVGVAPAWGKAVLTTDVSGTLPVANGGTGATTLTGYVKGSGTSAFTASATVPTSDLSGTLGVANGGTGTSTAFTTGSIVFAGASGVYSQDNANLFWDDTNNRLGIGTNAPASIGSNITTIHARGASGSGVLLGSASVASGASLWTSGDGSLTTLGTLTSMPLAFSTNSSERMRITSAGDVGIGTTAPTTRLAVIAGAGQNCLYAEGVSDGVAADFRNTGANSFGVRIAAGQSGLYAFTVFDKTTVNNLFYVDGGGNVGIGGVTSPGYKLTVNGSIASTNATAGLGYGLGAGGAVTQATSRTTGVTLNTVTGSITLVSAAGTATWQSFTVTNSAVAANDVVIVSQRSGADLYLIHVTNVAAGSFRITFATTGGTTTEQPVFNFAVIKGATS